MTLLNDFMFLLPNFMNAVMNYLAQIIVNALESYLRLGMPIFWLCLQILVTQNTKVCLLQIYTLKQKMFIRNFYDTSDVLL